MTISERKQRVYTPSKRLTMMTRMMMVRWKLNIFFSIKCIKCNHNLLLKACRFSIGILWLVGKSVLVFVFGILPFSSLYMIASLSQSCVLSSPYTGTYHSKREVKIVWVNDILLLTGKLHYLSWMNIPRNNLWI